MPLVMVTHDETKRKLGDGQLGVGKPIGGEKGYDARVLAPFATHVRQ